jgi:hypothetical protein
MVWEDLGEERRLIEENGGKWDNLADGVKCEMWNEGELNAGTDKNLFRIKEGEGEKWEHNKHKHSLCWTELTTEITQKCCST